MKQTNNAIKFLMAQYRAIFQNAYFKGLATAAVVTMAMAAGQAQAAAAAAALDNTKISKAQGINKDIVIDSSSDGSDNKWGSLTLSGGTITNLGKNITISDGGIVANFFKHDGTSSGNGTYTSTNKLTIAADANTKGLSILSDSASKGMEVTFGTVDVQKGSIALNSDTKNAATASLAAETITIGTGAETAKSGEAQVQINKNGSLGVAFTGSNDLFSSLSEITLKKGGTIKTVINAENDAGTINAGNLVIDGGDLISTTKSGNGHESGSLTVNIVKGQMTAGSLQTDHANANGMFI